MFWQTSMQEIDFLSVENEGGSKSGDAIAMRFWSEGHGRLVVVVIDAGFRDTGERMVRHIRDRYRTDVVDLAISTHPDTDHLNGLQAVIESLQVSELLVHRPRGHGLNVSEYPNLEAIDDLIATAESCGTRITEPFAGEQRFGGVLTVLGPTKAYYEQLLAESLATAGSPVLAASASRAGLFFTKMADLLEKAVSFLPAETLGEDGETSARNNTSVITLVEPGESRWLLTGDAGIPALHAALDCYEALRGPISGSPFNFVQVPHHGSRRNVSPSLLDRWLGPRGAGYTAFTAYVSSAKADPKHPSPKVTNAFARRGATVAATEGSNLWWHEGTPARSDYGPLTPIGPLDETDD
jgi:beta-lactamase superfamily II metal-dependent hydrolase